MAQRRSYQLSAALVAAHSGGPVICLDSRAIGHSYRLHASRPGAECVERITRAGIRGEVIDSEGAALDVIAPLDPDAAIMRVDIRGPIEQRAGFADECGGWSDGHDAIAERMIAALAEGNVLLVIDSPGGACAGLQESVRRVVEAKALYGRTVIVYADETIGSAAYWWAACVADQIYGPALMSVGSIGARGAHGSVAGALAQDGVVVTYFAWPNEGKVAFAPELPLSDLAKARGDRDVSIAGEAFADAVSAARGLSREEIVALSADMLGGQAAIDARLVDGVASLEDVMGMLLTIAEQSAITTEAA